MAWLQQVPLGAAVVVEAVEGAWPKPPKKRRDQGVITAVEEDM